MREQLAGVLEREGLDVHELRDEPRGVHRRDALLDVLRSRGDQQDVAHVRVLLRRAEHLEVVADLFHRERDVLVRLHLYLLLEVGVRQVLRHLHGLGDGRIARDRDRAFLRPHARALDRPADRVADGRGIDDRLLVDGVVGGRLGRVGLDPVLPARLGQLDQLDRRRRDVEADQRRVAPTERDFGQLEHRNFLFRSGYYAAIRNSGSS